MPKSSQEVNLSMLWCLLLIGFALYPFVQYSTVYNILDDFQPYIKFFLSVKHFSVSLDCTFGTMTHLRKDLWSWLAAHSVLLWHSFCY
jgi:hypothetical protein